MSIDDEAAQLREWAQGDNPRAAATELLIRTGLAGAADPWVRYDQAWQTRAIDFDAVAEWAGGMPGGEQRILRIAASLANGDRISLRDQLAGLDRTQTELVMIAVAHAAGYAEMGADIDTSDGIPRIVPTAPLATWPE